MSRKFLQAVPGLLVLLLAGNALAHEEGIASFVDPFDLGAGAGPAAMGATIGARGDVWSLTENPAGLADVKHTEVGFSHLRWFNDQNASFVGAAFGSGGALGLAYIDEGSIGVENGNGLTDEQVRSSFVGISGGWAFHLPIAPDVTLGVAGQAVQRNLAAIKRATWVSGTVGMQWEAMPGVLTLGAQLDNVGSSIPLDQDGGSEPQPTSIGGGLALHIPPGLIPQSSITLAADVRKTRFEKVSAKIGGEIWFANTLAARAAYLGGEEEGKFTVGTGIKYGQFNMDYSFRDLSVLGTTHRLSVSIGLGSCGSCGDSKSCTTK